MPLSARKLLWGIPTLIYAAFTVWYTNLAGPMSPEEIETVTREMREHGAPAAQIDRLRQFMLTDTGRQFIMVNVLDMATVPKPVEGAAPGESSAQLMNRYMEHMYPAQFKRACHPVFFGTAVFDAMDIVGIEGAERWTQAALFRYRSRRDVVEIATNPAFAGRHDFKMAALEKTIAYPVETQLYLSDPRLLLLLVLLAATALADIAFFGRRKTTSSSA